MICIYVAIGQKESTVASFVESCVSTARWNHHRRQRHGAGARAHALHRAIPGAAMGEYFMDKGKGCTIYDDLSKQAVAYRELSAAAPSARTRGIRRRVYPHSRPLEGAARRVMSWAAAALRPCPS